jgi:hypothetical protein
VDQVTPAVIGGQRIFDHQRIWWLSQGVFVRAADLIAEHEARYRPQLIVGVARGGLPLARHVAGRLGVETVEVAARHNAADTAFLSCRHRPSLPARAGPAPARGVTVVGCR